MYYDRERYEKLIIQSSLFSLDKEIDESAYKREALKMVEYLYCYLLGINEQKYEPYGYEITVVAKRCINGFKGEKGEFLHYFNAAWKQKIKHIYSDQLHEEKFRGVKVTEDEKRNIRKYLKLIRSIDASLSSQKIYENIADAMNLTVEVVKEIAEMCNISITSNVLHNSDGEESDRFEQTPYSYFMEDLLEESDQLTEFLENIELTFAGLQERQRPIISAALTVRIVEDVTSLNIEYEKYSFINRSIIDEYNHLGYLPAQRDIAEKYGRNEASISRTLKEFIIKLKEKV